MIPLAITNLRTDTQIHMTLTKSISRHQTHQPAAGAHLIYQQTVYVLVT